MLDRNSQAHKSLDRIIAGEYVPDSGAVGFTFEDESSLAKHPTLGWHVQNCVPECECEAGQRAAKNVAAFGRLSDANWV